MIDIPIELKKAICRNRLIVFVGTGLSYNLNNVNNEPIQGWSNLVGRILDNLKSKNYDVDHLISLVKKYEPITVLELIEKSKNLPKNEIYKFIKDFLDLDDNKNDYSLISDNYK